MKKQVLERLIKDYKGDDLAGYVAGLVNEEERITKAMQLWHQECRRAEEKSKKEQERLRKSLQEIRTACPHHERVYFGDPSGGNGSFWECSLCGEELRNA